MVIGKGINGIFFAEIEFGQFGLVFAVSPLVESVVFKHISSILK